MAREVPLPENATQEGSQEPFRKIVHGVRLEHEGFDNPVYRNLIWLADVAAFVRHTDVEGSLPSEGPAIVVANHSAMEDVFLLNWLATKAGRSMRLVARDTLVHPEIQEEDFVLERTGKKGGLLNSEPGGVRRIFGKATQLAGNPILVHRGKPSREFQEEVDQTLESGQMVGIFLQETRSPQNDLTQAMGGAAVFTRRHPDVPVYVVAMTNTKINPREPRTYLHPTITVDEPFTYNEFAAEGRKSSTEIKAHIVNRMARLLQEKLPQEQILLPER